MPLFFITLRYYVIDTLFHLDYAIDYFIEITFMLPLRFSEFAIPLRFSPLRHFSIFSFAITFAGLSRCPIATDISTPNISADC